MAEEIINTDNTEKGEAASVEVVGVSFKEAGKIYYFSPGKLSLSRGDKVIVETSRGVELGTVKVPNKTVSETEIVPPLKETKRIATRADLEQNEKNREAEAEAADESFEDLSDFVLEASAETDGENTEESEERADV